MGTGTISSGNIIPFSYGNGEGDGSEDSFSDGFGDGFGGGDMIPMPGPGGIPMPGPGGIPGQGGQKGGNGSGGKGESDPLPGKTTIRDNEGNTVTRSDDEVLADIEANPMDEGENPLDNMSPDEIERAMQQNRDKLRESKTDAGEILARQDNTNKGGGKGATAILGLDARRLPTVKNAPWYRQLEDYFIQEVSKVIKQETYDKINRRSASGYVAGTAPVVMPGERNPPFRKYKIAFMVDTSGSVSMEEYEQFWAHVVQILKHMAQSGKADISGMFCEWTGGLDSYTEFSVRKDGKIEPDPAMGNKRSRAFSGGTGIAETAIQVAVKTRNNIPTIYVWFTDGEVEFGDFSKRSIKSILHNVPSVMVCTQGIDLYKRLAEKAGFVKFIPMVNVIDNNI